MMPDLLPARCLGKTCKAGKVIWNKPFAAHDAATDHRKRRSVPPLSVESHALVFSRKFQREEPTVDFSLDRR